MRKPDVMTPSLTPRQAQTPTYLGAAMANREIWQRLGLAVQASEDAVTPLLEALGAHTRSGMSGRIQRLERRSLPGPHDRSVTWIGTAL